MKTTSKFIKVFIIILLLTVGYLPSVKSIIAVVSDNAAVISAPNNIRAIRKSNTAVRLEWKGVPEGDGYIIYRYKRSTKKYGKIHTVKGTKAGKWMKWTDKRLKMNTVYKYKIASYRIIDGKRQISNVSDWVSAKTYKRNNRRINARAPELSPKSVYLGLRSSKEISSYVPAAKYGKNKKKVSFSKKVRWYSSDASVATVNKKGVITAGIKPGSCYVYAKAHNGLRAKVRVTVKNYARVKEYYGQYLNEDDIYLLVTEYRTPMQNIAEYYSINRLPRGKIIEFTLNDEAEVVTTPANADIGNLRKDIETLLVDFPYFIDIKVHCDSVDFILRKEDNVKTVPGYVYFYFDNDCSEWLYQAASHWRAVRRAGI